MFRPTGHTGTGWLWWLPGRSLCCTAGKQQAFPSMGLHCIRQHRCKGTDAHLEVPRKSATPLNNPGGRALRSQPEIGPKLWFLSGIYISPSPDAVYNWDVIFTIAMLPWGGWHTASRQGGHPVVGQCLLLPWKCWTQPILVRNAGHLSSWRFLWTKYFR